MEKKEKADLTHSRPFPHPAAPYWERDTAIRNLSNLLDKYGIGGSCGKIRKKVGQLRLN